MNESNTVRRESVNEVVARGRDYDIHFPYKISSFHFPRSTCYKLQNNFTVLKQAPQNLLKIALQPRNECAKLLPAADWFCATRAKVLSEFSR